MRTVLAKDARSALEKVVEKARDISEVAAIEELQRLSVGDKAPADYLNAQQRELRNRLRAHARLLGDSRKGDGTQGVTLLVSEIAYEHWHRMLFARFLAENDLLMYEDGSTPLSIGDCFELAEEKTGDSTNGWRLAASYAAKMLPQIFRNDSPVFEIELAPNHQKKLEQLLESLDETTFQSQDALGWVYQFWQSKRKEEVNASEVKIGAREISPVTQLFTEPYMVSFLLDNALGAWWANKRLTAHDYASATSEAELRGKAAIDGVPLSYLRFIKTYTPEQQQLLESDKPPEEKPEPAGPWEPAAGKFEQWPEHIGELKTLDPCCGSGHFLVAAFLMLVPVRMQLEGLSEQRAIDAVLRENIHGLELDQRCVELAAFALALEAWRYPNGGGYRPLPDLHLACSGLSIKAAKEEWKQLGLGKNNLSIALDWMHDQFSDAPILGSLINPAKSQASSIVSWDELSNALDEALKNEGKNEAQSHEAVVVAQGLAKATTLLAGEYQLVVTNVPYLARGKQDGILHSFIESKYPAGKNDLATAFLERCLEFCSVGGSSSVVMPQNWLFLTSYKKLREKLLTEDSWNLIARLGAKGFQTPMWDFNVQLITLTRGNGLAGREGVFSEGESKHCLRGVDVSAAQSAFDKAEQLLNCDVKSVIQAKQLDNPDMSIMLDETNNLPLMNVIAQPFKGLGTGDDPRYRKKFWELGRDYGAWIVFRSAPESNHVQGVGNSDLLKWDGGIGELSRSPTAYLRNTDQWSRPGILIGMMNKLPATVYSGSAWDTTSCALIPKNEEHLAPLWCFAESGDLCSSLRLFNQKLSVEVNHFGQVPFDLDYWANVAKEKYPYGLPKSFSNYCNQWVFHGHPCGSVILDPRTKCTAKSDLRVDDAALQVAAARLLGYQWPAELDSKIELAAEQREWVEETKKLLPFVDDDGIVCLPAVRGEKAAYQRLEELLQVAYGDAWSTQTRSQLLENVGCKNKNLDVWLREKFFEQHCKLFQHRPFIWHIWDGLKDGFSALANYHKLDKKNLERLIYTYLDDWIRTQSHQEAEDVDGAAARLAAAKNLKERLELILEGEAPYDIFVRWKPAEEQPIGWRPDLSDGVRLNIRPFLSVPDVGKKGAGILRAKPNIHWKKDRGKDGESAPWYKLGLEYGGKEGDRINDHHLTLAEKQAAKT